MRTMKSTPPATTAAKPNPSPSPSPSATMVKNGEISLSEIETWVFDLDNTLYSGVHGLFDQIDVRMQSYVADFLGLSPDEAKKVQKKYFREFGTTLRGMMVNHAMEAEPFLEYVHQIDVSIIPPDSALKGALGKLPGKKIIFTNASRDHANRVLARLGIEDHFGGIFDIKDGGFVPKPDPAKYRELADAFNFDPKNAIMVEDIARNLHPAKEMGMATLWVRTQADCAVCQEEPTGDFVDFETDDLTGWLAARLR